MGLATPDSNQLQNNDIRLHASYTLPFEAGLSER
jgi:hypothetical protein